MKKTKLVVSYRRRRKGLTDYRKRLKLLLSKKPRLVVRRSLNNIIMHISDYEKTGDRVLAQARATELIKYGWSGHTGNLPAAYLTGMLLSERAKKAGVKECVVDLGFSKSVKGARVYAALKGFADGGIKIPLSEENLPSGERIEGKHIADYASKLKEQNKELYDRTFAKYLKSGTAPEQVSEMFNKVKAALTEKK
ncbi:50S ribosomal protein L18 [Candidatus Woesearchaeota archaeon]|nr:50S ribosomal protein L18 [Candidatus Woesearchaeota archaeon]